MSKSEGSPVDAHGMPQPVSRHVVDLRRTRVPEIAIVACSTYDLLLSLQVALASPEYDYADYDVGHDWVVSARQRAEEHTGGALAVLDRYLGHGLPSSLHATLISLVAECPPPRDPEFFLGWLAEIPINQFIQVLLDNAGQGTAWQELLAPALAEEHANEAAAQPAMDRLLDCFAASVRPSVRELIKAPERSRRELLAALWVWENAVFALEEPRVTPYIEREAAILSEQHVELPLTVSSSWPCAAWSGEDRSTFAALSWRQATSAGRRSIFTNGTEPSPSAYRWKRRSWRPSLQAVSTIP